MITSNEIAQLHVELSTKCQAMCPLCLRNDYGFKTRNDFPKIDLSYNDWKKIFDTTNLCNLKEVLFCGNFGDPLIAPDLELIVSDCFKRWPHVNVNIHTNGGMRTPNWWENFGRTFKNKNLNVHFSIDGLEDTNHLYRINVPYEKVIENAKAFINAGGSAQWKFILFKHNRHQIAIAKTRSQELGFTQFIVENMTTPFKTIRNKGLVFQSDTDSYMILPAYGQTTVEKLNRYEPILETEEEYQKKNLEEEVFWKQANQKPICHTINYKSVYLAANGQVFPCCYLGKFYDNYNWNKRRHNWEVIGKVENNALEVGFDKAIDWFYKVQNTWQYSTVKQGAMSECVRCARRNPSI